MFQRGFLSIMNFWNCIVFRNRIIELCMSCLVGGILEVLL